ncbi:MAG: hypothetical protein OHK0053_10900 [Microscillaceae bacterium]
MFCHGQALYLYRDTLLHWSFYRLILLLGSALLAPLTREIYHDKKDERQLLVHFFMNLWGYSGLIVFMFFGLNFYFPAEEQKIFKCKIIQTGHLLKPKISCASPYADVVLNGRKYSIIFPCDYQFKEDKFVILTLQQGLWGLDIITDKKTLPN